MHEMTVARALFDAVMEALDDHPEVERVVRVRVKVGRLSCIAPDSLKLCFSVMAERTVAQGAELVCEPVPVRVRCRDCSEESEPPAEAALVCPGCGSLALDIVSGRELFVDSMDVE